MWSVGIRDGRAFIQKGEWIHQSLTLSQAEQIIKALTEAIAVLRPSIPLMNTIFID